MHDMDENFNFYQAVMAQQHGRTVPEQEPLSLEALIEQIDDKTLAEKIRVVLKDKQ